VTLESETMAILNLEITYDKKRRKLYACSAFMTIYNSVNILLIYKLASAFFIHDDSPLLQRYD
jgi:hypothetical protein